MAVSPKSPLRVEPLSAQPQHLPLVARWHHSECLRQGLSSLYPRRVERLKAHLAPELGVPRTWIASIDSQVIGCVSLISYHVSTDIGPPALDVPLWLSNLYVVPEHRRSGVAQALMASVYDYVQMLGHTSVWLIAREYTEFYRKRQWQSVRQARIAKQWVTVMRRDIP